jgi:hypothetical protein
MHDFFNTSVLDENVIDTLLMLWPTCLIIHIELVFGATGGNSRFALFALSVFVVFDAVVSERVRSFQTNVLSTWLSDQDIAWFFSTRGGNSRGTSVDLENFSSFAFCTNPSPLSCQRSIQIRTHTSVVLLFPTPFYHRDTMSFIYFKFIKYLKKECSQQHKENFHRFH